jgi:hypothetical protein
MKSKIILALLILSFSYAFAQDNPYEVFGHTSKVVYETKVSEYLTIKNNDTTSITKSIAFNFEDRVILFLGDKDTILKAFKIEPEQLLRFLSVDPLTKDYPWYTPYQFAGNKPIIATDLDGLEEFIRTDYRDATGNLYKTIISMVSNFGVDPNCNTKNNRQTVHHTEIREIKNTDGSNAFIKEYKGTFQGTTISNNAFKSPSDKTNILADIMRQTALNVDASGNPILSQLSEPIDVPFTTAGAGGFSTTSYIAATQSAWAPVKSSNNFTIGFVEKLFDSNGGEVGYIGKYNKNVGSIGKETYITQRGTLNKFNATNSPSIYSPNIPQNDSRISPYEHATPGKPQLRTPNPSGTSFEAMPTNSVQGGNGNVNYIK